MSSCLITNARIVDSGRIFFANIFIKDGVFDKITPDIPSIPHRHEIVDAKGMTIIPGIIDAHVHFREPGLTRKADMASETKAALAGGVTSFMEMPNTDPKTTSIEALRDKFRIAAKKSLANYSFYLGATNSNHKELLEAKKNHAAGVKIFLGASTGEMLVDDTLSLETFFSEIEVPLIAHAESENIIKRNLAEFKQKYGEQIPAECHADIRNTEACFEAASLAVELAGKYNSRLHLAHLSTENELSLLSNASLKDKRITAEAGPHHLWFSRDDYQKYGNLIKCNPSIKEERHRNALWQGLERGLIDLVATDHAPHLLEEKLQPYLSSPSGIPLIQFSLSMMLSLAKKNSREIDFVVDKMCHAPALAFNISRRGFIREGYYADFVILDPDAEIAVKKEDILYKCAWSPLEGELLKGKVLNTFVNGVMKYKEGRICSDVPGHQLFFDR